MLQARSAPADWLRRERGSVAVEFAIILPILLMIVFGIIVYGRVVGESNALTEAARVGARQAATVTTATCASIRDLVRSTVAGSSGISAASLPDSAIVLSRSDLAGQDPCSLPHPCTTSQVGALITTTVTYRTTISIPFVDLAQVDLTGQGTFQCEYR